MGTPPIVQDQGSALFPLIANVLNPIESQFRRVSELEFVWIPTIELRAPQAFERAHVPYFSRPSCKKYERAKRTLCSDLLRKIDHLGWGPIRNRRVENHIPRRPSCNSTIRVPRKLGVTMHVRQASNLARARRPWAQHLPLGSEATESGDP